MVAPVAVVEGPVVGTTWSRVHPALVGPGTAPATPEVWASVAMARACSLSGTTTCRVPGAPGPEGSWSPGRSRPGRWRWPARW